MKKITCLILALTMGLFVLAGCGGSVDPSKTDRWQEGENALFKITMLKEDDEDIPQYHKEEGVQVLPSSVSPLSNMTYAISKDGKGNWVFDVTLLVVQSYDASAFADGWKDIVPQSAYVEANGEVTFTSVMTSRAVFGSVAAGAKPVSSEKTVKSTTVYYNKDLKYTVSYNDFKTTVAYDNGKAVATFDDKTGTVKNKEKSVTADVGTDLLFDNEAMLLAVRSVDFSVMEKNNTISLNFFNAVEQNKQEIAVVFDTDEYVFEGDATETNYVKVAANPRGMGYPYFFYFEQKETSPPINPGDRIFQYQMVKLCQGYLCYEKVAAL